MPFRVATAEEIELFEKVIYPAQDRILSAIGKEYGDSFYLSGGTALARFYFRHRLSEDLDIFTPREKINLAYPEIIKLLEGIGFKVEADYQSLGVFYGRLFVVLGDNYRMKIDLVFERALEKPQACGDFYLDTLRNIAVNKLIAFEDRAEMKDLIDLFLLSEHFSFEELLELADLKRVPVPYESLLTINSQGLTGSALLLKEVSLSELEAFVNNLKMALEENIKKKAEKVNPEQIIRDLLWDFPREERQLSPISMPVLQRRLKSLSLPARIALEKYIHSHA